MGLITIDSNIYITTFQHSPPTTAANTPTSAPGTSTQSQTESAVSQQGEGANAEERVIVIQALNPDGTPLLNASKEPVEVRINDDTVLDDLDKLFKNLPDGRYRISVIEPGETRPRILLDINLRGHKPADDAEENEGKPPASDEEASSAAASTMTSPGRMCLLRRPLLKDLPSSQAPVAGPVDGTAV